MALDPTSLFLVYPGPSTKIFAYSIKDERVHDSLCCVAFRTSCAWHSRSPASRRRQVDRPASPRAPLCVPVPPDEQGCVAVVDELLNGVEMLSANRLIETGSPDLYWIP